MNAGGDRWEEDRLARAAWTRLVEPGDVRAGAAIEVLGAVDALGYVRRGDALPPAVAELAGERRGRRGLDDALAAWRSRLAQLSPERDLATVRRRGGRLVVPADEEWPGGLGDLGLGGPPALWVLGSTPVAAALARSVSVVGARASTAYGEHVAGEIGAGCADRGITVVSGGAFGIDAAAHRGALGAGGLTVAVLACGVDRYYPQAHEGLLRRVAAQGLVVAEVAPGSTAMKGRFLQRNRLIAALSGGTVVVEAAWRSGALSTAAHAAGLGRALGAVPGPVTSALSAGCHRLLRDYAATCVTDAAEVVELVAAIGEDLPAAPVVPRADHDDLSPTDLRVLDALPVRRGATVDSLAGVAGLPGHTVEASLGRLALAGLAGTAAGNGERVWRRERPTRRA